MYNPLIQQALEFLQEKLLGDGLPASKKTSVAYSSLFHAINCIEQKIAEGIEKESQGDTTDMSEDSTPAPCEFN